MTKFPFAKVFERQKAATRGVHEAIEEVRLRTIVLQDEREMLRRLPVDRQRAIDALDQAIVDAADRLDLRAAVAGLVRPVDGRPRLDLGRVPENLVGPWLAVLAADRLRDFFLDQIDDFYDGRDDPAEDQRPAAIAALDAEVLSLELVEEALVRQAERAGVAILRRGDADPRAVLAHDDALPS